MKQCPFCQRSDGLYVDSYPNVHTYLRFSVECVCGASGAPRSTAAAAEEWWDTRQANKSETGEEKRIYERRKQIRPSDKNRGCADCGTRLNDGEAVTFTVCDKCWGKAHPIVLQEPNTSFEL